MQNNELRKQCMFLHLRGSGPGTPVNQNQCLGSILRVPIMWDMWVCVCVSSALIWCLNKWFLPPRVCLQYITLATMELPLSSSLGTSRSLAHAWPRGKCRPVNNTEMLNDVRTPTQDALSDTVLAYRTCSLLIIIFISWYAYPLFFGLIVRLLSFFHHTPAFLTEPLPKVRWLTFALGKLVSSQGKVKPTKREHWEDLGTSQSGRKVERKKKQTLTESFMMDNLTVILSLHY